MHIIGFLLAGLLVAYVLYRVSVRLQLSRAKHPSLTGHSKMARRFARWIPFWEYDESTFFRADGAPADVEQRRRDAFMRLAGLFAARFAKSAAAAGDLAGKVSDVDFTSRYRVPFQFSRFVREHLKGGNFVESSAGVQVRDLDGNEFYDVTGAYGVNVFGYDFYKDCMAAGARRVAALGPVLGVYHPVVKFNVEELLKLSGLDEVSFHMSGTEAVMQAVRLARYHTRRTHLVRFCGAYHGWWGDVQPGVGNPVNADQTYTLSELSGQALKVIRSRRDIACVLVNPLQALHPNAAAPGDNMLVDSGRRAHYDRAQYTAWLQQLRAVCTERGIALIFDEVFVGFRLALGGAQEYFGVRADLVTYGKTLAGGFPVGALCGTHAFMRRFREDRPADICFARGTFNSHPVVMGGMAEFLTRIRQPDIQAIYAGLEVWERRAAALNERFMAEDLPVRVASLSSIWTLYYVQPSRYNWMYQYYLRAAGLALSWVGTGRLIFSLNFSAADFEAVATRLLDAARQMRQDGWWWAAPQLSNRAIRRRVLREMLQARWASASTSAMGSISSPRSR